jgi:pyruvate dehydrogenase E2 component (dihydrolipoamide acetyltransferase)
MTEQLIKVPDIGGAEGAEVVEVLVAVGDRIALEQSIIVVESDKASMEIPANLAGTVTALRVAVGDAISEGDVILGIDVASSVPGEVEGEVEVEGDAADAHAPSDVSDTTASAADPHAGVAIDRAAEVEQPRAEVSVAVASQTESSGDAQGARQAAQRESLSVVIPDLGSDQGAELVECLVAVGSAVDEGDSLVLLESDKASMEVPAPAAGVLSEWLVTVGSAVKQGDVIALMSVTTAQAPASSDAVVTNQNSEPSRSALGTAVSAAKDESQPVTRERVQHISDSDQSAVYAGPAVRKLAREFGVTLAQVTGTGARGRIQKEDLQQHVAQALSQSASGSGAGLPTIPEPDYARFGQVERVSRSRVERLTADNMVRAWLNIPHVTQFGDADVSDLEDFRQTLKQEAADKALRLTPLPFILKACAVALSHHPKLQSSLADGGDSLIFKHYCHIGMAVETPGGLVVPVIRDVDKKTIWQLAEEITTLAQRARDKQLKPDEMQGGVFTVSSLGAIGGKGFTPIINAPEVAILGVGCASVQPVWDGASFQPRTRLPLALSYDHRVVNGGEGGRFLAEISGLLADVRRLIL